MVFESGEEIDITVTIPDILGIRLYQLCSSIKLVRWTVTRTRSYIEVPTASDPRCDWFPT